MTTMMLDQGIRTNSVTLDKESKLCNVEAGAHSSYIHMSISCLRLLQVLGTVILVVKTVPRPWSLNTDSPIKGTKTS